MLGPVLIAVGLFAMISPFVIKSESSLEKSLYVGAAAVVLGLMIVSSYGGTVIDFNKKSIKDYFSFLGFQFGKWISLPNVIRIVVAPVNYKATNTPNGISPTWSGIVSEYHVLLYSDHPTPIRLFVFSNRTRALKAAKLLSANLDTVYELKEP